MLKQENEGNIKNKLKIEWPFSDDKKMVEKDYDYIDNAK